MGPSVTINVDSATGDWDTRH